METGDLKEDNEQTGTRYQRPFDKSFDVHKVMSSSEKRFSP